MRGPVAPKDPTKKRAKIYFMLEDNVTTAHDVNGRAAEVIYLENRISGNVRLICPELSEDLTRRLQDSHEFFKIVHSIGIIMETEIPEDKEKEVTCQLLHYAKHDRYRNGTRINMEVCCDGAERIFPLSEYEDKEENEILGAFYIFSDSKDFCGKATVIFYLQDGFEVPEPVLDPPIAYDTPAYARMLDRSLMSLGNVYRLRKTIEKAERGEDVTLAFIGGSITQGAGAKPINTESYVYRVFDGFRKNYASEPEKVRLVKAGLGGTSSELGLLRYEHDVLRNGTEHPDLVIIEFAVNDEGDETKGICYESLVAKAYNQPEAPAVLLLFSVFMNDWNLQERLAPIGKHYDLPMVSVLDAVTPQFGDGEDHVLSKRQYFYDCFHPTNDGHRVMADCVLHLLDQSLAQINEEPYWPAQACLGREYAEAKTVHRNPEAKYPEGIFVNIGSFTEVDSNLQTAEIDMERDATPMFAYNWKCEPKKGMGPVVPFVVRLRCRSFFLIFKDSGDAEFGKAVISVDGKAVRTFDPRTVGWNHCNAVLILSEEEPDEHEIRVFSAAGDEEKCITILAFSYVE